MEIEIDGKEFREAAVWTAAHANSPFLPVLGGVLLEVADQALTFSAFDHETSARLSVPGRARTAGRVLVPGRLLADAAKTLKGVQPVRVSLDERTTTVQVTSGRTYFHLPLMPVEDYPTLPELPPKIGEADAEALAEAIAQGGCVSADARTASALPALSAVRIRTGPYLTFSSTDRYRVAHRQVPWQAADPASQTALLAPRLVMAGLAKVLEGRVELFADDRTVGVRSAGRQVTVRTLDSEYPSVDKLVDDFAGLHMARVDSRELLEALKSVRVMLEGEAAPVRLMFLRDALVLEAPGPKHRTAAEATIAAEIEGKPTMIHFNPEFLAAAVASMRSPHTCIQMKAPERAALFTAEPVGKLVEGDCYRHLLMSVRA